MADGPESSEGAARGNPGRPPVVAVGADLIIPLLSLAFAAYFYLSIRELAWEAKANGLIIGSILVVLVAVQLVRIARKVRRGEGSLSIEPLLAPRDVLGKRTALVAVTIAFIATIKWLGLTLGLFLGMLAALRLMGVRRPRQLLGISFVVAAAAYALFIAALESNFPHGPVEKLIASLL